MTTPTTRGRIRLGRVAGVAIEGHVLLLPIVLLVIALLATSLLPAQEGEDAYSPLAFWGMAFLATLILLISVLAHELAHALVARSFGQSVDRVMLFMHGGEEPSAEAPGSPWHELAVAVAGAGTTFLIAALAWLAYLLTPDLRWSDPLLQFTAGANLLLGVASLIPAFPLDGGRILRASTWALSGSFLEGTRLACFIAKVFALLLGSWSIAFIVGTNRASPWFWGAALGLVLWFHASNTWRVTRVRERLRGLVVADLMSEVPDPLPRVVSVEEALTSPDLVPVRGQSKAFLVEFGGRLGGVVTLRALRHVEENERGSTTVGQVSRRLRAEHLLSPRTRLSAAQRLMAESGLPLLPVLHESDLVGVLTRDALNGLLEG